MIQRREWYVMMAVSGLAVVCVVGLALAQDLDEDGAIVSEEMLLEDAVNGSLDEDVDDLLLEDMGDDSDLDDLLGDLGDDVEEVDDLLDEEMPADDVELEEPAEEIIAVEPEKGVPDEMEAAVEAPVEAPVEALVEALVEEPIDELAEELVEDPMAELADELVAEEPVEEIVEERVAEELVEEVVEEIAAEMPVEEEMLEEDVDLDSDSDLDLLVEGAIQDALAEGVPEPPALDAEPAAEAEPVEEIVDVMEELVEAPEEELAEAPVEELAEAPVEELIAEEIIEEVVEDVVEDVAVEEAEVGVPIEELLVDDVEEPASVDEEPTAVVQEVAVEEAPIEPAVVELTEEEKAEIALNQALDVMGKQEELRRQALEAHGREVLTEADAAAKARDYKEAERLFEEAQRYITDRPGTAKTRGRIRVGQANNYFLWAQALQRKGEVDAARELGQRALAFKHPRAAVFLEELGKAPVVVKDEAPKTPAKRIKQEDFITKQAEIAELLRTGRQHLINGEYDRAQGKFEAVLQARLDPQNTEAIRMIQKVAQKRYDRASMEVEGTRREMMTQVRKAWNPRDYGLAEAVAQEAEDVKPVDTGKQEIRDRIRLKMEEIKIPEIDFRQANIHDVVDFLQMASVDFDPADISEEEKGVNIILSLGQSDQPAAAAPPSDDPFANMLDEGGAGEAGQVPLITFTARYISLLEALKIVTQVANLKYRIEGSVVMIVPFNAPEGDIVVRMYDVLPAVEEKISLVGSELDSGDRGGAGDFIALESAGVQAGGADWKAFFADMGVEWPDRSSIKYVRTIGKIVVANTEKNLAVFEKVLEVLNVVPSQIEIEARFVEVTQTDLDSLGFEWLMDNTWQVAEKRGQGNLPPSARQRIEISAGGANGDLTGGNRFYPDMIGETVSAVTAADSVLKIGSVLTNPELSMVLHMLQQRGHSDLLSAPKVTTKSGNEATIKVVTEYIYPTEFEIKSLSNLGGGGQNSNITLPEGVSPFAAEPSTFETREVGVILSVLPEVSTEGQMINLNMTPEVVSEPLWKDYGLAFGDIRVPMEQPFFHTRSVSTSISIYNGATVVMGGMITEKRTDVDDRVPFLGSIPLIGRLFRSSYEHSEKRNLLIFVTARLVDPNGLPISKQEEVPLPEGMVDTASE